VISLASSFPDCRFPFRLPLPTISRAQPYLGLPQRHIRLLADAAPQRLPDLVARLMKRRSAALSRRRAAHRAWQTASTLQARGADRSHTRDRSRDHGLEL